MDNFHHLHVDNLEIYKDFFDNAQDLLHIVDPDGKIIYVNNAWEKVLGFTQQEVSGKIIYSFVEPEDLDLYKLYRKNVLENETEEKEIIIRFITKNGSRVFLEGYISSKFSNGKALYTKGVFRNITLKIKNEQELKQINEQLKERESNINQLLQHAPDAIIVINAENIITYWNPKAEAMFGWTKDEVVGTSLSGTIIPKQHRQGHESGMKRYLATRVPHVINNSVEITAVDKSGKEFYVSLTVSVTQQNGRMSFISFIRNIDEQKKNALELEQKKKQLEVSNNELEQFAHTASHDMKEPIRKIVMFAGLLKSEAGDKIPERWQVHINKIHSSGSRLVKLVDGILAYSSQKSESVIYEEVDLNEIVKSVETDLELIVHEKNATVKTGALPVVKGSSFMLYQLFYNLINNSLKFTKQGIAPHINITASKLTATAKNEHLVENKLYHEIVVEDNGIGFDQAQAENIFSTFKRLNSKAQFEGTGLGLSLCKSIVEKHGRMIKAYGKINEGAKFKIWLPEEV